MWNRVRALLLDQSGNALVLVAAGMVAMLGFTAVTVDGGAIYTARARAQTAADAAALAGAQFLPGNPSKAETVARDIAARNGMDPALTSVALSVDHSSIRVAAGKTINLGFARILGFASSQQEGVATARTGAINTVTGLAPLAVPAAEFEPGVSYTLKADQPSTPGNFFALALGDDRGASAWEENMKEGWHQPVSVGDLLTTEPGNMSGPTQRAVQWILDNYPEDSDGNGTPDDEQDLNADGRPDLPRDTRRLVIIPIVDDFPNGRGEVKVLGFAAFYIEGFGDDKSSIKGRFVNYITAGDFSSGSDYGLKVVKLTK